MPKNIGKTAEKLTFILKKILSGVTQLIIFFLSMIWYTDVKYSNKIFASLSFTEIYIIFSKKMSQKTDFLAALFYFFGGHFGLFGSNFEIFQIMIFFYETYIYMFFSTKFIVIWQLTYFLCQLSKVKHFFFIWKGRNQGINSFTYP